jgi:hypothetical protein
MDESRNGRITRNLIRWAFFIVFYLFFSGGTEYFFKPKLFGQRVQMHTLLVFFLDHRLAAAFRHPGNHSQTAGGHRFSDHDEYLSRQLSESGRTV